MRVIAGTARGHTLTAPQGYDCTRPTADRMKENLFNLLTPYLQDARFLDLFCGSGAVGIEALSRGAESAVFVDVSRQAVDAVKTNLQKTRLFHKSEILSMPVDAALRRLAADNRIFDIIFLDPPYSGNGIDETLTQLARLTLLSENALIVAERSAANAWDAGSYLGAVFELCRTKTYGNTQFIFLRKMEAPCHDGYLPRQL